MDLDGENGSFDYRFKYRMNTSHIAAREISDTDAIELEAQLYNWRLVHYSYGNGYPEVLDEF